MNFRWATDKWHFLATKTHLWNWKVTRWKLAELNGFDFINFRLFVIVISFYLKLIVLANFPISAYLSREYSSNRNKFQQINIGEYVICLVLTVSEHKAILFCGRFLHTLGILLKTSLAIYKTLFTHNNLLFIILIGINRLEMVFSFIIKVNCANISFYSWCI